jgi:hypothetical protein
LHKNNEIHNLQQTIFMSVVIYYCTCICRWERAYTQAKATLSDLDEAHEARVTSLSHVHSASKLAPTHGANLALVFFQKKDSPADLRHVIVEAAQHREERKVALKTCVESASVSAEEFAAACTLMKGTA